MSTTIKSLYGSDLSIESVETDVVLLKMRSPMGDMICRKHDRRDLLAALRTEGILPAEPEPLAEREMELLAGGGVAVKVHEDGTSALFDYGTTGHTESIPAGISPDEMIALGLHLKANPPELVDRDMVDALARSIYYARWPGRAFRDCSPGQSADYRKQARRLYLAGVRIEQAQA